MAKKTTAKKKSAKTGKGKGKATDANKSKYISQVALAKEFGVSKQRISELVSQGFFPFETVAGKKKLLADKCRESWKNRRHYTAIDSTAPDDIIINHERAAHERAKRIFKELEIAEKERSLISADEVKEIWQGQIIRIRSRLLSIPKRAGAILGLTGSQQAEINKLVKEALHELKEYKEK